MNIVLESQRTYRLFPAATSAADRFTSGRSLARPGKEAVQKVNAHL